VINDLPNEPLITAVVVNFNGGSRAVACVRSLLDYGHEIGEIILVDNGSTDGSRDQILEVCGHTRLILLTDNPGPSIARNRGLEAAGSDLVLLADADTRLTEGALAEMVAVQRQFNATLVCPRLVFAPGETVVQCDGAEPHFVGTLTLLGAGTARDTASIAKCTDGVISTFMLVDRKRVLDAGGFDESYFFYFEDLEFSASRPRHGMRTVCHCHS